MATISRRGNEQAWWQKQKAEGSHLQTEAQSRKNKRQTQIQSKADATAPPTPHQAGTECSNSQDYGGPISHFNHLTEEDEWLSEGGDKKSTGVCRHPAEEYLYSTDERGIRVTVDGSMNACRDVGAFVLLILLFFLSLLHNFVLCFFLY